MARFILPFIALMCLLPVAFSVKPSGLACEGCHGVVSELHEKLSKPTNTPPGNRVPKLLEKICKLENLVKYVFSPPKMVKACNELLEEHKKDIQKILISSFEKKVEVSLEELEDEICFKTAGSCVGIKESPKVNLADHKQTVSADLVMNSDGRQELVFEKDGEDLKLKQTGNENEDQAASKSKENTKPKNPKSKYDDSANAGDEEENQKRDEL